jgi:hypothetical protein
LATGAGLLTIGIASAFQIPRPRQSGTPTPTAAVTETDQPREYFVPPDGYHELPPECYESNLIQPREIILHWDGNTQGRDLWLAPITYETLKLLGQSSHFAVDYKRVWQMLPMYQTRVQESHGAKGFNWLAINVEMAGIDFDRPDNYPPEDEIRLTVRLVSQLMDFYGIPLAHVVGHYERDPRGLKQDPGINFMADFHERLRAYRARVSPMKRAALATN